MKQIKFKIIFMLLAIQFMSGCGGGDSETTSTYDPLKVCSLTTILSGEIQQSINWDCSQGIGVGTSGNGFRAVFGGLNPNILFTIEVGAVVANQIVDNRTATITIMDKQNQNKWQTASNVCVVNVAINNTQENSLGGTGTCQGNQATPVAGSGATGIVNIGDFTFQTLNPL